MKYEVYTDGSCWPNPDGVGGWACKVIHDNDELEFYGGENFTTNNRMELRAIIEGLSYTPKNSEVIIYSDSTYCVDSIMTWMKHWVEEGFPSRTNDDLLKEIYDLMKERKVKAVWIRGHNGNEHNERVDMLANKARKEFEEEELERLTKEEMGFNF